MQNNHPGRAENYTDAFLWTVCLLLFMVFFVMTAFVGFLWAFVTSIVLNRAITAFARYKNR